MAYGIAVFTVVFHLIQIHFNHREILAIHMCITGIKFVWIVTIHVGCLSKWVSIVNVELKSKCIWLTYMFAVMF